MLKAIAGANWGDEGKGKIVDFCASDADIVARFQGGANAGHTILNEYGKFSLHQLPSGVFYKNVTNVITGGVVLDMEKLIDEINSVKRAVDVDLKISDRVQILMPYHILQDIYEEERLAERQFGSTRSGIAPAYSDKYAKSGFQLWELFRPEDFKIKLKDHLIKLNILFKHLYNKPELIFDDIYNSAMSNAEKIGKYMDNASAFLNKAIKENKTIYFEAQLGTLKDIDNGTYPYVTSSSTVSGYALASAGVPVGCLTEVIAVTKAYATTVGEGPFVTELFGGEADELRARGGDVGEFGATTGRPRRVGHFDCVATKYGFNLQGSHTGALTCLDVLGYMDEIKVCTAYEIDDGQTTDFPTTAALYKALPIYETLPGWKCDIRGQKDFDKLPQQAKDYIAFLEARIEAKFKYISTGPRREETIVR